MKPTSVTYAWGCAIGWAAAMWTLHPWYIVLLGAAIIGASALLAMFVIDKVWS